MCLILLAKEPSDEYKFVMASNRDEFYSRPTKSAHWWENPIDLLAGKDLEQGGTWMGISKKGKFAAVTNVRDFYTKDYLEKNFLSRGDLVRNFFTSDIDSDDKSLSEGEALSLTILSTTCKQHGEDLHLS